MIACCDVRFIFTAALQFLILQLLSCALFISKTGFNHQFGSTATSHRNGSSYKALRNKNTKNIKRGQLHVVRSQKAQTDEDKQAPNETNFHAAG